MPSWLSRTPQRSLHKEIASTIRQADTPSICGLGPLSIQAFRSASWPSARRQGACPLGLSMSPCGPAWLKRITPSRRVWRSIAPDVAAWTRRAPSSAAARATRRSAWARLFVAPAASIRLVHRPPGSPIPPSPCLCSTTMRRESRPCPLRKPNRVTSHRGWYHLLMLLHARWVHQETPLR